MPRSKMVRRHKKYAPVDSPTPDPPSFFPCPPVCLTSRENRTPLGLVVGLNIQPRSGRPAPDYTNFDPADLPRTRRHKSAPDRELQETIKKQSRHSISGSNQSNSTSGLTIVRYLPPWLPSCPTFKIKDNFSSLSTASSVPTPRPGNEKKWLVVLRVYDLTSGKVKNWSRFLLGQQLQGIWHTSVVVYGYEYFYGDGIVRLPPSAVLQLGDMELLKELPFGRTNINQQKFESYLNSITDTFNPSTYDMIKWNCNHFANACLWYLLDSAVPKSILKQHEQIIKAPAGRIVVFLTALASSSRRLWIRSGKTCD